MHLQHIFQLISLRRGKDYAGTQALFHLGPVKMHFPVVGVRQLWLILHLGAIDEESQDLGFDGISPYVLRRICCQLNCLLCYSATCILVANDLRDRSGTDHSYRVLLEIMLQFLAAM